MGTVDLNIYISNRPLNFTVVHLVASPLSECEAEVDLGLGQTSFVFLWKLCLKNTRLYKNNMIYIGKQEGLVVSKQGQLQLCFHL